MMTTEVLVYPPHITFTISCMHVASISLAKSPLMPYCTKIAELQFGQKNLPVQAIIEVTVLYYSMP